MTLKLLAFIVCLIIAVVWVAIKLGRKQQLEKIRREQDEEIKHIVEQSGQVDIDVTRYTDSELDDEL